MMPMGGMAPMGPMPMPMGSVAGSAYGTPYPGNALMMNGMGSEYGAPFVDGYPPTIARTHSLYGDDRDLYDRERGYYDRGYGRDYYDDDYERGRRQYDGGYSRRRGRSYSRSSRRSRGDYYDDPYYDYDYGRGYGDYYDGDYYDRYSSRYRGSDYYPSSSRHYSSRSGRKREELSVIKKDNGDIKVLRDGQERISDKFRRMFGLDPKGMNIVRVKRGEQLAAHISR